MEFGVKVPLLRVPLTTIPMPLTLNTSSMLNSTAVGLDDEDAEEMEPSEGPPMWAAYCVIHS